MYSQLEEETCVVTEGGVPPVPAGGCDGLAGVILQAGRKLKTLRWRRGGLVGGVGGYSLMVRGISDKSRGIQGGLGGSQMSRQHLKLETLPYACPLVYVHCVQHCLYKHWIAEGTNPKR